MSAQFDPSIYFVADPACCAGRSVIDVVIEAVEAGVTLVQYRDKSDNLQMISANAALLSELLKSYNVPLIVNDYVDLAVAASADGVHLGQGDASIEEAREKFGEDAIIGQTAFTEEHIKAVDPNIVDYIGTGPFYPTQTDKGKPVLGAEKFAALAELSPVPVVGIGGITPDNVADVIAAGADGIAMMRAISEAHDISGAVKAFRQEIDAAKAKRAVA